MDDYLVNLLLGLADGNFHSGESLGRRLGVSRAAVWKRVQSLQVHGVVVESVKGMGYRIAGGLDLLDERKIVSNIVGLRGASSVMERVNSKIEVHSTIDSTNSYLMRKVSAGDVELGQVCLAEMQVQGRGRRGRQWQSGFGRNVALSVAWRFDRGVAALEGLSLAVAVVLCEVLQELGCQNPSVKWPNDIYVDRKKLGGILIEIQGDASGECYVVVGVGLNLQLGRESAVIDQPWIDLREIVGAHAVVRDRNVVVARIISGLWGLLSDYEASGFCAYRQRWQKLNVFQEEVVSLSTPKEVVEGQMVGVDESGNLMLRVGGELRLFSGGEVSLRGCL